MTEYRFAVADDGTITRGTLYCMPPGYTEDGWLHYWDSDQMVAFWDGFYNGVYAVADLQGEDVDRAMEAHKYERGGGRGTEGALDRVARRITGQQGSRFIVVNLDRGADLYALSWSGGDPDNEWRDEIEAVYHGEVYRISVERYEEETVWYEHGSVTDDTWHTDDEYPEEFYGEDKARAAYERLFPLAEFPAERFVTASA